MNKHTSTIIVILLVIAILFCLWQLRENAVCYSVQSAVDTAPDRFDLFSPQGARVASGVKTDVAIRALETKRICAWEIESQ